MEHFTSRKEKFDLLDQAIARHDGNAITRIIIWLKDTLKRDPNLMKDLMAPDRAVGMNHYICYLKEMKEYDELSELLISLNRYNLFRARHPDCCRLCTVSRGIRAKKGHREDAPYIIF